MPKGNHRGKREGKGVHFGCGHEVSTKPHPLLSANGARPERNGKRRLEVQPSPKLTFVNTDFRQ
jgi:hypothetical protein